MILQSDLCLFIGDDLILIQKIIKLKIKSLWNYVCDFSQECKFPYCKELIQKYNLNQLKSSPSYGRNKDMIICKPTDDTISYIASNSTTDQNTSDTEQHEIPTENNDEISTSACTIYNTNTEHISNQNYVDSITQNTTTVNNHVVMKQHKKKRKTERDTLTDNLTSINQYSYSIGSTRSSKTAVLNLLIRDFKIPETLPSNYKFKFGMGIRNDQTHCFVIVIIQMWFQNTYLHKLLFANHSDIIALLTTHKLEITSSTTDDPNNSNTNPLRCVSNCFLSIIELILICCYEYNTNNKSHTIPNITKLGL